LVQCLLDYENNARDGVEIQLCTVITFGILNAAAFTVSEKAACILCGPQTLPLNGTFSEN
jgi:hypothetical protein